jgi:plastocyanin
VLAQNQAYLPPTFNVRAGTTVTWVNKDADDHSATSDAGAPDAFDIFLKGNGGSGTFTFTKVGTYSYGCKFHSDMHGMIIVT